MRRVLLFISLLSVNIFSQEFGMGILLDDTLYANRPLSVKLMRGDYANLPSSFSLKEYAPVPGYQGSSGTCAAWSAVYGGKTILEAMKNRWTKKEINDNRFSPSFVYNQVRKSNGCSQGVSLISVLDFLKENGVVKYSDFGFECDREVKPDEKDMAKSFKILEYRTIADYKLERKSSFIKKSLSENKPVIAAIDCPSSFKLAKDTWQPDSSDYKNWFQGHGITIVGFDDKKLGGAFEILNSWGTKWGNSGYTWVSYSDFDYFCKYAFELIDPEPETQKPMLSGSLSFTEDNGDPMKLIQSGNVFETVKNFPTGTLFELRISNDEPAYVYAFATDITLAVTKIFPSEDNISAYLPYKQNNIAIPDEDSYAMLDNTKGVTYYVFLYSKEKLDFEKLVKDFELSSGGFSKRFESVFGKMSIEPENISFDKSEKLKFRSLYTTEKKVVPVIVKINHK
jgi:hypothetical protein